MSADPLRVWAVVCSDGQIHYETDGYTYSALSVFDWEPDLDDFRGFDCGPHRVVELVEAQKPEPSKVSPYDPSAVANLMREVERNG